MKNFALKHALLVVLSFEGKKSVVTLLCVCSWEFKYESKSWYDIGPYAIGLEGGRNFS